LKVRQYDDSTSDELMEAYGVPSNDGQRRYSILVFNFGGHAVLCALTLALCIHHKSAYTVSES
jgi:hypothetical protein